MSLENITLDIDFVRKQFPAFKDPLCKNWAFFENAGGSYVPQTVINHLNKFMTSTKVQPYAEYNMSKIAGDQMDKAVSLFAQMINAKNNEILITLFTPILSSRYPKIKEPTAAAIFSTIPNCITSSKEKSNVPTA